MPFIIWGSRGVTSIRDSGTFHCPQCGPGYYTHREVKKYFTLYWIPLFPVNTVGDYVECDRCGETYNDSVLSFDPDAGNRAFMTQLDQAARRLMALMVLADGTVDPDELQMMIAVSTDLPAGAMTLDEARQEVAAAAAGSADPVVHVAEIKELLSDAGRELLLDTAVRIAAADGHISDEEKILLMQIGEALELDVEGLMATLLHDE